MDNERRLLPIILRKNPTNELLKSLCYVCVFLIIAFYLCLQCCRFVQDIVIPILISIFTAMLVTLCINKEQDKNDNRRLIKIRNEELFVFFFSLSNYFSSVAHKVQDERSKQGLPVDYNKKMHWYEWMQQLVDLLSEETVDYETIERRKRYLRDLQKKGRKILIEAERLNRAKLSLYMTDIVSQEELHEALYIGYMVALADADVDTISYDLLAIIDQLIEAIDKFEDYKFLNTENRNMLYSQNWKPAEE